ncbi:hypothetical protein [Polymorphobacter fuscus]|uniref:Uncharacterized protein n=1 Tax=Sandarakinorhabdus fusca TaxID=1439888 RepID=A0A7C9GP71_9SPHN|nr:hypothetical protein [Polymorphobacter fuscus]KAB7648903.1 hypothetical protein F9290_04360 [Polymorphobacter fuscus]MQT16490.1 hypothetical protein [Polymorphobacter fuscus]NJC07220.1 hypothetical protein [Polymorphobacter fuscus]
MISQSNVAAFGNTQAPIRIAAHQLTEQLIAAEAAIDAAVAAVAALAAGMPLATQQANVGTHVLQESLMHAMETCQTLVKSRTQILRTHRAMSGALHNVGLTPMAIGDVSKMCEAELDEGLAVTAIAA